MTEISSEIDRMIDKELKTDATLADTMEAVVAAIQKVSVGGRKSQTVTVLPPVLTENTITHTLVPDVEGGVVTPVGRCYDRLFLFLHTDSAQKVSLCAHTITNARMSRFECAPLLPAPILNFDAAIEAPRLAIVTRNELRIYDLDLNELRATEQ